MGESLGELLDPLWTDPVLWETHFTQVLVRSKRLGPCRCRAVLQSIPPTYDRPQVGFLARGFRRFCILVDGVGNDCSTCGAHAVVVKLEPLDRRLFQKVDHILGTSTAECVVGEVEFHERRVVCEGITDG